MPFAADFILKNFNLLLKTNVKINAGGILALTQEENKLNLLWDQIISALTKSGTEETSDTKDEIIVKLFSYFNTDFIQAGDFIGVCAHLAEGILSRLDPRQYPEDVFRINGDDYLKLRRSVGPALDREECVRMKFINAKREILSEDLGL